MHVIPYTAPTCTYYQYVFACRMGCTLASARWCGGCLSPSAMEAHRCIAPGGGFLEGLPWKPIHPWWAADPLSQQLRSNKVTPIAKLTNFFCSNLTSSHRCRNQPRDGQRRCRLCYFSRPPLTVFVCGSTSILTNSSTP